MIIRKIRPGEYKRCQELCALAFEYPMADAELSPEALLERKQQNPRSTQDVHWDSQWAAFEDDDQTMMATMTVIPWTGTFDGHGRHRRRGLPAPVPPGRGHTGLL